MKIERAVTVNVEAAHCDEKGRMHGHSYLVECWTTEEYDLPAFERKVRAVADQVDHTTLEASVGAPTMEALGAWFLKWNYGYDGEHRTMLSRVVVRRPTLGFAVEVSR